MLQKKKKKKKKKKHETAVGKKNILKFRKMSLFFNLPKKKKKIEKIF